MGAREMLAVGTATVIVCQLVLLTGCVVSAEPLIGMSSAAAVIGGGGDQDKEVLLEQGNDVIVKREAGTNKGENSKTTNI